MATDTEIKTVVYKLVADLSKANQQFVSFEDRAQAATAALEKLDAMMTKMARKQKAGQAAIKANEILGLDGDSIRLMTEEVIREMKAANDQILVEKEREAQALRSKNASILARQRAQGERAEASKVASDAVDRRQVLGSLNFDYGASTTASGAAALAAQRRQGELDNREQERRAAELQNSFARSRSAAMTADADRRRLGEQEARNAEARAANIRAAYSRSVSASASADAARRRLGELETRDTEAHHASIRNAFFRDRDSRAANEAERRRQGELETRREEARAAAIRKAYSDSLDRANKAKVDATNRQARAQARARSEQSRNMHYALSSVAAFGGAELGSFMNASGMGHDPLTRIWTGSVTGGLSGMGLGGSIGMTFGGVPGAAIGAGLGAGIGGGIGMLTSTVGSVVGLFTSGIEKAVDITKAGATFIIEKGMEYERSLAKFTVMTGSKEEGSRLFNSLEKMAINSPYTTRQVTTGAETLLGYGISSKVAPEVMRRLGDIAGGDPVRLERLALAYGQVHSQGKLAGQELRQFAEAGVGAADIAQTMGIDPLELRHRMEKGAVPALAISDTINRLTSPGGRFFGMSDDISKTVSGQSNRLLETTEMTGRRIGKSFFDQSGVGNILGNITSTIGGFAGNAGDIGGMLASGFKTAIDWADKFIASISPGLRLAGKYAETFVGWLTKGTEALPSLDEVGQTFSNAIEFAANAFAQIVDSAKDLIPLLKSLVDMGSVFAKVTLYAVKGLAYTPQYLMMPGAQKSMINAADAGLNLIDANQAIITGGLNTAEKFLNKAGGLGKAFGNVNTRATGGGPLWQFDKKSWYSPDNVKFFKLDTGELSNQSTNLFNPMMALGGGLGAANPAMLPKKLSTTELVATVAGQMPFGVSLLPRDFNVPAGAGVFGGLGMASEAIKSKEEYLPHKVRQLIDHTNEAFEKGGVTGSAFSEFKSIVANLSNARSHINPVTGIPFLSDGAFNSSIYNAFQNMAKATHPIIERLPSSASYGSAEALRIMQESMDATKSQEDKVLEILQAGNDIEKQIADTMDKVLNTLKSNGVVLMPGERR